MVVVEEAEAVVAVGEEEAVVAVGEEEAVVVAVGAVGEEVAGGHHQIGHTMIWDHFRRGIGIHFLHY